MLIQNKVHLTMGAIVLIFLVSDFVIQRTVIFPTFIEIEHEHAKRNIDRIGSLFDSVVDQLDRNTYDWASWDDTYEFIENLNTRYINSNLSPDTFYNTGTDLVYFLNNDGEMVWGDFFDHYDSGGPLFGSDAVIDRSLSVLKPYIEQIDPSLSSDEQYARGVVYLDGVPVFFAARSILTSEGDGPRRGVMVQGKVLGDRLRDAFEDQLKVEFDIQPVGDQSGIAGKLKQSSYDIRTVDDNVLEISKPYFSNGHPVLTLSTLFPRDITQTGMNSVSYALLALSAVGVFSVLIVRWVMQGLIFNRLDRLARHMQRVSAHQDYGSHFEASDDDEVGTLAREFNHLIGIVDDNTQDLKKAFRRIKEDNDKLLVTESQLKRANNELHELTQRDPLTGIGNRLQLANKLEMEWRRLRRNGSPLAVLMIDIDYFKQYNDGYGHQVGDECLRQVATIVSGVLKRSADLAVRYGGEEFAAVLPDTDTESARSVAHRIQKSLKLAQIPHEYSPSPANYLTISIGVAAMVPSMELDAQDLLKWADIALYQSKADGRDRITVEYESVR